MGSQARPGFFCSRPNGTLTPLIALDELPTHVTVRGVARNISPNETQGMTSCGVAVTRNEPWIIDVPVSTIHQAVPNDANELSDLLIKILREENVSVHIRQLIQGALLRHLSGPRVTGPVVPNVMSVGQAIAPAHYVNNGNQKPVLNNNKKEFCSYWIRHGECDYQQQGCLYKHEMPADPAMLEKLGLRDIPRWYREKYDVPSMLQPNYGNFHPQPAIVDQPAMRAIQYNAAADTSEPTGNGNNHHRGANNRFKSSRGVGFQGRARGGGWHKVGHRDNFPPTSAVDTTPESSASTSEEYLMANTFAARVGALNIDGGDPQEDGGVRLPDQHLLDKEGMSINPRLVAELLSLTDEVPMDHDMVKDLEKQAFRTKSRRLFDNSNDGSLKKSGENKTPATSPVDTNDVNTSTASPRGNAKLPRPAMADLLESSDPIISDQTLLFWGPIGEPVERRGSMNSNQSGSTVGSQFGWSPAN